jgi:hypothetical protein
LIHEEPVEVKWTWKRGWRARYSHPNKPRRWRGNAPRLPDECFFSIITRQAIRRGSFRSAKDLTAAIGAFTGQWNEHTRPFAWTKDPDEVLSSINRAKTKAKGFTGHWSSAASRSSAQRELAPVMGEK